MENSQYESQFETEQFETELVATELVQRDEEMDANEEENPSKDEDQEIEKEDNDEEEEDEDKENNPLIVSDLDHKHNDSREEDEEDDEEEVQQTPREKEEEGSLKKPKKPLTAYFIFLAENRSKAKQALIDENSATSVAEVGKKLGLMWKEMDEVERQKYVDSHNNDRERYTKEMEEWKAAGGVEETEAKEEVLNDNPNATVLPISRVKKLVMSDGDVKRITKDALIVLCKSTENLLKYIGTGAAESTAEQKRKTVLISDFYHTVHTDDKLDFLRIEFPQAEGSLKIKKNKKTSNVIKKPKQTEKEKNKGMQNIAKFFTKA